MERLLLITPAATRPPTWSAPRARSRPRPAPRPLADRRRRLQDATPAPARASPPRRRSSRSAVPPSVPRGREADGLAVAAEAVPSTRRWRGSTSASSPTSASSTPTSSCRPITSPAAGTLRRRAPLGDGRRDPAGARTTRAGGRPGSRPPRPRRPQALQRASASRRSAASRSGSAGTRSTRPTPACRASHPLTSPSPRPATTALSPTRGGTLRGRARHGHCAYILRYGFWWVALRSLKVARLRPRGLSGLAFLYGYLRAAARREGRVEDESYRRFVAQELRDRVRAASDSAPVKVPTFFMRS